MRLHVRFVHDVQPILVAQLIPASRQCACIASTAVVSIIGLQRWHIMQLHLVQSKRMIQNVLACLKPARLTSAGGWGSARCARR